MTSVSVITPAIPPRLDRLGQAMASVRSQRHAAVEHLVAVDNGRHGSAAMRNKLLRAAEGEFIAPLDDDDYLLPNHLAELTQRARWVDAPDVVYSYCKVTGRGDGWVPNREFDADALRVGNYIPVTALVKRELLLDLAGWRDSAVVPHGWEDWDLWLRALDAGAKFACVPEVTWVYCFGPGSKTAVGERAAY